MADSPLIEMFKALADKFQPVAQDRHYKYPIYDAKGYYGASDIDGLYAPKLNDTPAVLINSKHSPMSYTYKDGGEDPIEWMTRNKNSGPATLAHERVHHIQKTEYEDPDNTKYNRGRFLDIADPKLYKGFEKIAELLYGNRYAEAHAFTTSNTMPEFRDDTTGNFIPPPNLSQFMLGQKPKTENALDPNMQAQLQKLFYDKLSDKAKQALRSRQNWVVDK